jgi:hypothetical protein
MGGLYDDAISRLTTAIGLGSGTEDIQRNLMAMRARARHAQGVWNLIGNTFSPGNGLLSSADAAAAAADATAALALDPSDWTYWFEYFSGGPYNDVAGNQNSRLEMRFSNVYVVPEAEGKRRETDPELVDDKGIALDDPVGGAADMRLDAFMTPYEDDIEYADLPILSAAEMHLILAEDALVNGTAADFATHINAARTWGSLPDWTVASGVTEIEILIYERQVELFLQQRRLHDMYRYGIQSPAWQAASHAATAPGTFFPITKAEIDANCYINPDWPEGVPCGG